MLKEFTAAGSIASKEGRSIREMFSSIAGTYDFLNHLFSWNLDRGWRRRAVHASAAGPGNRVLDVCSGTGDLAFAFLEKVGSKGTVVASDFSIKMLKIAQQKAGQKKRATAIKYFAGNLMALPFVSGYFHVTGVAFGIRNVQNMEQGVLEMARVTRPGGKVVVLEFTRPRGFLSTCIHAVYIRKILPWLGDAISGSKDKAYAYLAHSTANFLDKEEMTRLLTRCGLLEVEARLMNFGLVALHVGVVPGADITTKSTKNTKP